MPMCYTHHKLIDVDDPPPRGPNTPHRHDEQRLLDMKAAHEERIRIVTEIAPDRARTSCAMALGSARKISTGFLRSGTRDAPEHSARLSASRSSEIPRKIAKRITGKQSARICRQFETKVSRLLKAGRSPICPFFALAPIPLLVELGRLLCDTRRSRYTNFHRELAGWRWAKNALAFNIGWTYCRKAERCGAEARSAPPFQMDLNTSVLGQEVPIWGVTAKRTATMTSCGIQRTWLNLEKYCAQFIARSKQPMVRTRQRACFSRNPVSVAVECGRVWMPKADLPLVIYDEIRMRGFVVRLKIG